MHERKRPVLHGSSQIDTHHPNGLHTAPLGPAPNFRPRPGRHGDGRSPCRSPGRNRRYTVRPLCASLVVTREYALQVLIRYAHALILNAEQDVVGAFLDREGDRRFRRGMIRGVAQKIVQLQFNQPGIAGGLRRSVLRPTLWRNTTRLPNSREDTAQ